MSRTVNRGVGAHSLAQPPYPRQFSTRHPFHDQLELFRGQILHCADTVRQLHVREFRLSDSIQRVSQQSIDLCLYFIGKPDSRQSLTGLGSDGRSCLPVADVAIARCVAGHTSDDGELADRDYLVEVVLINSLALNDRTSYRSFLSLVHRCARTLFPVPWAAPSASILMHTGIALKQASALFAEAMRHSRLGNGSKHSIPPRSPTEILARPLSPSPRPLDALEVFQ